MANYRLPMDEDGVKYHGVEDDGELPGQVIYGADNARRPEAIKSDGRRLAVVDASVLQELETIKQQQEQILDRLNEPIDTKVTGSIVVQEVVKDLAITGEDRKRFPFVKPDGKIMYFVITNNHNVDLEMELRGSGNAVFYKATSDGSQDPMFTPVKVPSRTTNKIIFDGSAYERWEGLQTILEGQNMNLLVTPKQPPTSGTLTIDIVYEVM